MAFATDWPALMEPVARDLLDGTRGTPKKRGAELRYGSNDSMSVDFDRGVFSDFEADVGGGVVDLVRHVRGCGRSEALSWLREGGYLSRDGEIRPTRPRAVSKRSVRASSSGPDDAVSHARAALVHSIWSSGEIDTSPTPVRAYLRSRRVWIPGGYRCVRWLARERAPAPVPELRWFGLPRAAAGAAVYAYERAGGVVAVSFEALTADGVRIEPRWRPARGPRAGSAFRVRVGGDVLHVAEGEVDALALARGPHAGAVYGLGGTGGLGRVLDVVGSHRRVVVHADAGGVGGRAAVQAVRVLRAAGLRAWIVWCRDDPASDWETKGR